MTELPRKAGRYHVAKHIMLYVPPLGRPWFDIRVTYTRDYHQQQLYRKLYINVTQDFVQQLDNAKHDAAKLYSEVRKRTDEYIKALANTIAEQKREEMRQVDDARAQRTEHLRMQARSDVQRVWAFYGPEIEMRKPFYIFQWI